MEFEKKITILLQKHVGLMTSVDLFQFVIICGVGE